MGEILFLSHRIPFPPDRGDKIRSHHLLKALVQLAPVHVGTFAETEGDLAAEGDLARIAASYRLVRRSKPLPLAGLDALATGRPISLAAFDNAALRRWVGEVVTTRPIDTIFVFSGQMGQYIPADFSGRVVIDLCDVDSAKFEAYGASGHSPRSWIDRREGVVLAREEERLVRRADTVMLVSENEAELLRSRLHDVRHADIRAIRNGIDAALFDPVTVAPHPGLVEGAGPHLVFTGQMDYPPNIAAAERMVTAILPALRASHPSASFHIVGRAPTGRVQALEKMAGVRVWGEVPDVRPFLRAADLVVAPLDIARGIQNKVLEAMAMGRPVLVSPEAATGIDAEDGTHFAIADTDAAMIEQAIALLEDTTKAASLGRAARDYVLAHQAWPAMLAPLARIARPDGGKRDAA
ncbi:TIGR03087 family PEP-CTERM/XrtA system glycosyltransferase [Qipengyuania sp. CAU 1752]